MVVLKMNLFKTPEKYSDSQLGLLYLAEELGLDTKPLENSQFSIRQLRCLILAAHQGVDIEDFAKPGIDYYTMLLIIQCAKRGINYASLIEAQLNQVRASAIYYNLTQGLSVKGNESDDELFEQFEIATGISRKECQIPIYVEWSQGISQVLIDSRYMFYRNKFINEGLEREEAENEAKKKIRFEFS